MLPCSSLSVIFDDSSPKGGAKTCYTYIYIGAFLPLPTGEVAARSADGEGGIAALGHPIPLTPFPKEGGHEIEGAAHLWA